MDLHQRASAIRRGLADCVALRVAAGLRMAEMRETLGAEFPTWVSGACGLPLSEAELLMRWAAKRPNWSDRSAVDLDDPLAFELMTLGLHRVAPDPEVG